jgi:beta-lactamase regulating signal transducer with metallopeptidase domain
MEKNFANRIKNNGQLIVFVFFFLLFVFQLFIGTSVQKNNNQNYKENIERIKNELKDIETSLKTNNLKKQKTSIGPIHIIIWLSLIFICITFCILSVKRNYNNHGNFEEENVEYFIRTVHSSNFETNDESFFKYIFQ